MQRIRLLGAECLGDPPAEDNSFQVDEGISNEPVLTTPSLSSKTKHGIPDPMVLTEDPAPFENEMEPPMIAVQADVDDDEEVGNEFEHGMTPTHVTRVPPDSFQFSRNEGPPNAAYPPRWVSDEFEESEEPPLGPMATFVERKRGTFAKNSVLRLLDCDWTPLYATCGKFGEIWKRL